MSKGSNRRPSVVPRAEFAEAWERTFASCEHRSTGLRSTSLGLFCLACGEPVEAMSWQELDRRAEGILKKWRTLP